MVWWLLAMTAQGDPGPVSETTDVREADPCLKRRAVRRCDALQLAVHTDAGSFDSFVFAMHHAQAEVFWFQDRETGAFLRVEAKDDEPGAFLGEGWTVRTVEGVAYRVERVLRETYVLRRDDPLAVKDSGARHGGATTAPERRLAVR